MHHSFPADVYPFSSISTKEIQIRRASSGNGQRRTNILKVKCEICGQNGLLQQLHEVTVFCRGEVREDVMSLWGGRERRLEQTSNTVVGIARSA